MFPHSSTDLLFQVWGTWEWAEGLQGPSLPSTPDFSRPKIKEYSFAWEAQATCPAACPWAVSGGAPLPPGRPCGWPACPERGLSHVREDGPGGHRASGPLEAKATWLSLLQSLSNPDLSQAHPTTSISPRTRPRQWLSRPAAAGRAQGDEPGSCTESRHPVPTWSI